MCQSKHASQQTKVLITLSHSIYQTLDFGFIQVVLQGKYSWLNRVLNDVATTIRQLRNNLKCLVDITFDAASSWTEIDDFADAKTGNILISMATLTAMTTVG